MSRRNIILVVIIVVLLAGAGYVLYNGFFAGHATPSPAPLSTNVAGGSSSSTPNPTATSVSANAAGVVASSGSPSGSSPAPSLVQSGRILPLGTHFDLSLIKKYNSDGKLFLYPLVDASQIGPALSDIIKKGQ